MKFLWCFSATFINMIVKRLLSVVALSNVNSSIGEIFMPSIFEIFETDMLLPRAINCNCLRLPSRINHKLVWNFYKIKHQILKYLWKILITALKSIVVCKVTDVGPFDKAQRTKNESLKHSCIYIIPCSDRQSNLNSLLKSAEVTKN